MKIDEKVVTENFEIFRKLCESISDDRKDPILRIVDHFGERLALCPASSREKYHASFPGGLIDHSLRVYKNARILAKSFNMNVDPTSLLISALFHDFGKVGDLDADLYLPETSEWHREKLGQNYKVNEEIQKMPNAERGLWIMQHFGVKLTLDEWIAIRCNDGPYAEENKYYSMSEPNLALVIHMADRLACQAEKDRTVK